MPRARSRRASTGSTSTSAFEDGELIHTEISAKFTRARVEEELTAAGLELDELMTDAAGDFAVTLSRKG